MKTDCYCLYTVTMMTHSRNQAQFRFYGRCLLLFAIVCCVLPTDTATVLTGTVRSTFHRETAGECSAVEGH